MISQRNPRNVYEESPERLQELVTNAGKEPRQELPLRLSRKSLLQIHESQLKLLSEGNVPVRSFILPIPYAPARKSANDPSCRKMKLADLRIEEREPDTVVIVRTITQPYIYSATITIVEDEDGNTTRLTIGNLEDVPNDPIIPDGTLLAVKQPCWTRLVEGGYHIRVDHLSDLAVFDPHEDIVPEPWRRIEGSLTAQGMTAWKKEGDMMFLKKRFRKALQCYNNGLSICDVNKDHTSAIDLYRKRCGVNIVLLRLDDAAHDLSLAISAHARSNPSLSETKLVDTSTINSWLRNQSTDDPLQIATQIPRPLKELAARIKFDLGIYQSNPSYNLSLISSYVGPLTLHVDAANYVCDTEVQQTARHGRGLFAKRAFKTGELICVEKAFVMPGYFIQDRSSDCLLYSLGDGLAAPRPGALLFKELVQKLRWNPSVRKEFFDLDDGGYWKKHGWEIEDDEEIPVDVFRVEKIRQLNCFSVPTRSVDMLSAPPNSNPEMRNGFWNHASYVNHSCIPNTVRTFMGDVHFVRATCDIASGDELTYQYIAPEIDIADRQEKYRATWGFECDCRLCQIDGAADAETRKRRLQRFEELKSTVMKLGDKGTTITSIKKIARGLRELEALYSPAGDVDSYAGFPRLGLVHPTLFLTEAWRGVKNIDRTIEYAMKLLRNFGIIATIEKGAFQADTSTGLINVETVRALKYLTEGYTAKGETELARQCRELAETWFVIIAGSETGMEEFLRF